MKKNLFKAVILLMMLIPTAIFAQNTWDIQFKVDLPEQCQNNSGIAIVDSNIYVGNIKGPYIIKLNRKSEFVDSIEVKNARKSMKNETYFNSLTWTGKNMYYTNGTFYVYKLNEKMDQIIDSIFVGKDIYALAVAYDKTANKNAGGLWVYTSSCDFYLYSLDGTLLDQISPDELNFRPYFWDIAIDNTHAEGPYIYGIVRIPQEIYRINPRTRKMDAPVHNAKYDFPEWGDDATFGIYVDKVTEDDQYTLGILYEVGHHGGFNFSTVNNFENGTGFKVLSTDMPNVQKIDEPFEVSARFVNVGNDPLTSCTMNYQIDGKTVSCDITGNYLDYYKGFVLTHDSTYTPTTNGNFTMQIWLSNINGNDTLSTDTLTYNFLVHVKGVQRCVLHEEFTSCTCGPCHAANQNFNKLMEGKENFACIKYQMNWPGVGDPYYTTEGRTRQQYYGIKSVPLMYVDGSYKLSTVSGYTEAQLVEAQSRPSYVEMTSDFQYDGNKGFFANITAKPVEALNGSDIRMFAALVEKETFNNYADEYLSTYGNLEGLGKVLDIEFHFVMKKFLSATYGDKMNLREVGKTVSQGYSYEFNGRYRCPGSAVDPIDHSKEHSVEDFNNIILVYWLQDVNTKEVFQAGMNMHPTVGIKGHESDNSVRIYPNPAQNILHIESENTIKKVSVFNMVGQNILNTNEETLNISNLTNGIYMLKVETDKGTVTKKFIKR